MDDVPNRERINEAAEHMCEVLLRTGCDIVQRVAKQRGLTDKEAVIANSHAYTKALAVVLAKQYGIELGDFEPQMNTYVGNYLRAHPPRNQ